MEDGEKQCPLCGTTVVHPDFTGRVKDEMYPSGKLPTAARRSKIWQIILAVAFALAVTIVVLCDLQINHAVSWSGYVIGALVVGYTVCVLPLWFRHPNPVIFVPCDFLAGGLFILYICLRTGGKWFLPFALPMICSIAVLVCAVVTLMKYLYKGRFFIFGGAFIAFGGLMLLCENLLCATFTDIPFVGWSLYPLIVFAAIGGLLIFLGICRPARESMERKFFI